MLPGALGQQFDEAEMRIELQELADRAGAIFIHAKTCGLDLQNGKVNFSDHDPIPFDALSIGVGSMPAGWEQHSNSPLFVPIKPMQTFLKRLAYRLDTALAREGSSLRIAIVGGGVASVEIAFCLQQRMRKSSLPTEAMIEIYTSSDRVADGMREHSIARVNKLFEQRGISVHTGHRVIEVRESEIVLDDGRRRSVDCVVWATGASAPPVLRGLGLQTDDLGFIATRPTLQSLTDPRIFAVGDSGTVIDSPSAKAGVYAVRQSPILWHNLRSQVFGEPMRVFKPQRDFLKLLNTGDGKALLEYGWLTVHARWCWRLKSWIDKRFIRPFQAF